MRMELAYAAGGRDWQQKLEDLMLRRQQLPHDRFALDVRGTLDSDGWTGELIREARKYRVRLYRHLVHNATFGAETGQMPQMLEAEAEIQLAILAKYGRKASFRKISVHPPAFQFLDTFEMEGVARFALTRTPTWVRSCVELFPQVLAQFRAKVKGPSVGIEAVHPYLHDPAKNTPPVFFAGQLGWLWDLRYWHRHFGFEIVEDLYHGWGGDLVFHRGQGVPQSSGEFDYLPVPTHPAGGWTRDQYWLMHRTWLLFVEGYAPVAVRRWRSLRERLALLRPSMIHVDMGHHVEEISDGEHLAAGHLGPDLGNEWWDRPRMIDVIAHADRYGSTVLVEPEPEGRGWSLGGRAKTAWEAHQAGMDAICETLTRVRSGEWHPAV